ncbi:MAG: Homoserine kinase [Pseudomonadota bacterium]|jgi:homoserine kinase
MLRSSIKSIAPASVANFVCAFDVLGFALATPYDEVILRTNSVKQVRITKITGDQNNLSLQAEKNTAGMAIISALKHLNSNQGIDIELHKHIPLGSGIGSSAASAAAAIFALNALLKLDLPMLQMIDYAMDGENVASGCRHADNIAPSLMGGCILVRSLDPLDVVSIPIAANLYCTIVHPDLEINTKYARSILPTSIPLADAIKQWGNIAALITGLTTNNCSLIGNAMYDYIAEPIRGKLIKGFAQVRQVALDSGAIGAGISGSGPSVFALSDSEETANKVGQALGELFLKHECKNQIYVSQINKNNGAKIL